METPFEEHRRRERARLVEAQLLRGPDTQSLAEVVLELRAVEYRGKAEGVGHGTMDLRVCAEATLDALRQLFEDQLTFRLVGVKSVKAFDDNVAIVAVNVTDIGTRESRRFIGTAAAPGGNMPMGVARAVLCATNRVLGNYITTGD